MTFPAIVVDKIRTFVNGYSTQKQSLEPRFSITTGNKQRTDQQALI